MKPGFGAVTTRSSASILTARELPHDETRAQGRRRNGRARDRGGDRARPPSRSPLRKPARMVVLAAPAPPRASAFAFRLRPRSSLHAAFVERPPRPRRRASLRLRRSPRGGRARVSRSLLRAPLAHQPGGRAVSAVSRRGVSRRGLLPGVRTEPLARRAPGPLDDLRGEGRSSALRSGDDLRALPPGDRRLDPPTGFLLRPAGGLAPRTEQIGLVPGGLSRRGKRLVRDSRRLFPLKTASRTRQTLGRTWRSPIC